VEPTLNKPTLDLPTHMDEAMHRTRGAWRTWTSVPRAVLRGLGAWFQDDGPQLGAAVAFYSIFALAPVLVVTISIAGAVFGPDAARGHIVDEIAGLVGTPAARNIEAMIASAWHSDRSGLAAAIGVVTLLVAATGVFTELRNALNVMFGIRANPSVLRGVVRARVMAFALLLGFGFLLIVSLILSAALAAAAHGFSSRYPLAASALALTDVATSVLELAVAFAVILRGLPDHAPSWRAIVVGAATGAVLFSLGKHLVGLYLVSAGVATSYGAAGSFVVVIFWVYYSTQVLLIGAAIGRHVADVRTARQIQRCLSRSSISPSGLAP
jgi:membrane protein